MAKGVGVGASIEDWFTCLKEAVLSKDERPRLLVIGNAACDMDSMVSSLIASYCLGSLDRSKLSIPIFRCAKEKYDDKHWYRQLMKKIAMPAWDQFFFIDSFDHMRHKVGTLELLLVDHCHKDSLTETFWPDSIYGIIDHHEFHEVERPAIESLLSRVPSGPFNLIIIKPGIGSCSTLVWEEALRNPIFGLDTVPLPLLEVSLLTLIEDTEAFAEHSYESRWTDRDKNIFDKLLHELQERAPAIDQHSRLQDLWFTEREVWTKAAYGMNWDVVLRMDHKVYTYGNTHVLNWASLTGSVEQHLKLKGLNLLYHFLEQFSSGWTWWILSGWEPLVTNIERKRELLIITSSAFTLSECMSSPSYFHIHPDFRLNEALPGEFQACTRLDQQPTEIPIRDAILDKLTME